MSAWGAAGDEEAGENGSKWLCSGFSISIESSEARGPRQVDAEAVTSTTHARSGAHSRLTA